MVHIIQGSCVVKSVREVRRYASLFFWVWGVDGGMIGKEGVRGGRGLVGLMALLVERWEATERMRFRVEWCRGWESDWRVS